MSVHRGIENFYDVSVQALAHPQSWLSTVHQSYSAFLSSGPTLVKNAITTTLTQNPSFSVTDAYTLTDVNAAGTTNTTYFFTNPALASLVIQIDATGDVLISSP